MCRRLCHLNTPPNRLYNESRVLFRRPHPDTIGCRLGILHALTQIGDIEALPIVERLAYGKAKSAGARRIQAAAKECLPILQARQADALNNRTLLRAFDAFLPTDNLLRAASDGGAMPKELLLRPGQGDKED